MNSTEAPDPPGTSSCSRTPLPFAPARSDPPEEPTPASVSVGAVADGLRSVRNVTPFLWFLQSYADVVYPEIKTSERRIGRLRERHPKAVWCCAAMDLILLLILISLVVVSPILVLWHGAADLFK